MSTPQSTVFRWELRMGQRGLLDRLPVAHTASVTSLDWRLPDEAGTNEGTGGLGWIVSAGLDRCVKVSCFTRSRRLSLTSSSRYGTSANSIPLPILLMRPPAIFRTSQHIRSTLHFPFDVCFGGLDMNAKSQSCPMLTPSLEAAISPNWQDRPQDLHMHQPWASARPEPGVYRHQIYWQAM
jgi:hypothetical protein